MNQVDLAPVAGNGQVRNLAGKDRGEQARTALKLDDLDKSVEPVVVHVPDYIYAISSSFFLGMFSQSIARCGSQEAFLRHYKFDASDSIMKQVLHGIERAVAPMDAHIHR